MNQSTNSDKKVDAEHVGSEDSTRDSKRVKSKKKRRKRKQISRISRLYGAILTNNVTQAQSISYAIYERGPVKLYRSSFRKSYSCSNQFLTADSLPTNHRFCIFPFYFNKDDDNNCPKLNKSSPKDKSKLNTHMKEQETTNNMKDVENPYQSEVSKSKTLLQSNMEQDKNEGVKESASELNKDLVENPPKGTNQKESDSAKSPKKLFLVDKEKAKSIKRETSSISLNSKDAEFRALLEEFKEIPKLSREEDIPGFTKRDRKEKLEREVDYSDEVFIEDNEIHHTGDVNERQLVGASKDPYFDFENDRIQHLEEESKEQKESNETNFDRLKDNTLNSEFNAQAYEDDHVLRKEEERLRREKYDREHRPVHDDHRHGELLEDFDGPFAGIYSDRNSTRQGKDQNRKENIEEKRDLYVSEEGKDRYMVKLQMEYQTVEAPTSKEVPEQDKSKQQTSSGSIWERRNEEKLYQRYGLGRSSQHLSSMTNLDADDTEDEEKIMYHPVKRKFKFGYVMQYPWEAFVRYTCDKSEEPPQLPSTSQSLPHRRPIRIIFDVYGRPIILHPFVRRPETEGGYCGKWSPFGMPFDNPELPDEELAGNDVYVQLSVSYVWYKVAQNRLSSQFVSI